MWLLASLLICMQVNAAEIDGNKMEEKPGSSPLSRVATLLHGYDYISLFAPSFNIPVSLDNLLQGIGSIDDCF